MSLKYLVLLLLLIGTARAEPPAGADPGSPLGQWYKSLMVPGQEQSSCCSVADCRPVQARMAGDRWEVLLNGHWEPVPADRILERENLDGRAVACLLHGYIRCFVPPPET